MSVTIKIGSFALAAGFLIAAVSVPVDAQAKRRKTAVAKKPVVATPAATPSPETQPPVVKSEPKKNERPASGNGSEKPGKAPVQAAIDPTYYYEFAQPEFTISKIVIEHDDRGRGTITFTRKLFSETVSDPLQVSPAALERIDAAYAALSFMDSQESYQYEKDYSHLGVSTFKLKRAGKQRTAVFNYTINKGARALSDEYRKLSNQFVWVFDITLARENQPLESPMLVDLLDSLLR